MGGDNSRYETHVFNASESNREIWVKVDHEKAYLNSINTGGSAGGGAGGISANASSTMAYDLEWRKCNPGFVRIRSGYVYRFDVHADLVYITVRIGKDIIAHNYEIMGDYSVLINPTGDIERVMYGSLTEAKDGHQYRKYWKGGP